MKYRYLTPLLLGLVSTNALANEYLATKQQIRQQLVNCVNDPDNGFSAPFNNCITTAADQFIKAADKKIATDRLNPQIARKNQQIFHQQIKQCDHQQNLSNAGYTHSARCRLRISQDYYRYTMNNPSSEHWDLTERIDRLFLSY